MVCRRQEGQQWLPGGDLPSAERGRAARIPGEHGGHLKWRETEQLLHRTIEQLRPLVKEGHLVRVGEQQVDEVGDLIRGGLIAAREDQHA